MKREITSHPTPSLLNYNNLTHMGWPPWQRERGGEPLCGGGEGIPALGDHSSYRELRYEKTDLMCGSPRRAAWGLVKVAVRRRPHVQPPALNLRHLMTSTWNEETKTRPEETGKKVLHCLRPVCLCRALTYSLILLYKAFPVSGHGGFSLPQHAPG